MLLLLLLLMTVSHLLNFTSPPSRPRLLLQSSLSALEPQGLRGEHAPALAVVWHRNTARGVPLSMMLCAS